jgi:hypothetical protein
MQHTSIIKTPIPGGDRRYISDSQYLSQVAQDQLQSHAPHQAEPCELHSDGLHGTRYLRLFMSFSSCFTKIFTFPDLLKFQANNESRSISPMPDAEAQANERFFLGRPQTLSCINHIAGKNNDGSRKDSSYSIFLESPSLLHQARQ